MKLKHPDTDIDFVVGPSYFLGVFDVYDREETLGAELDRFDPNDPKQLADLIRRHVFEGPSLPTLSPEHKAELIRVLKRALEENVDFAQFLRANPEDPHYFALPGSWEIRMPRAFFEEIYRQACEHWDKGLDSPTS